MFAYIAKYKLLSVKQASNKLKSFIGAFGDFADVKMFGDSGLNWTFGKKQALTSECERWAGWIEEPGFGRGRPPWVPGQIAGVGEEKSPRFSSNFDNYNSAG